jgi:hypothetical protein
LWQFGSAFRKVHAEHFISKMTGYDVLFKPVSTLVDGAMLQSTQLGFQLLTCYLPLPIETEAQGAHAATVPVTQRDRGIATR